MDQNPGEGQPCLDRACSERHEPSERIGLATVLCAERGVRLTALRRRILELLWESGQPLGAYDLIEGITKDVGRPVGPPTVYRALEFLMGQGLVSKIQSRNAYVPCSHPERSHNCVFFMCVRCGSSSEVENPHVKLLLDQDAARLGYRVARLVVEVEGTCSPCVEAAGA